MIEYVEEITGLANIKVIGVGGGGGNAVDRMIAAGLSGVEFMVANTDAQALNRSQANIKLQIGAKATKGLGAGANPEIGRTAAEEESEALVSLLSGSEMLFITAGLGGGTGTGAAPIIADIAKELGILTVGVVTKPFTFEGRVRQKQADSGLTDLQEKVDSLITIPNQRLLEVSDRKTSLQDAFCMADDVLLQAVRGISDLINIPGLINVDFADVKTVMSKQGIALMGSGCARGEGAAIEATKQAISSPLLENARINGAQAILLNVTGSNSLSLAEVDEASSIIYQAAHEEANIIFGTVFEQSLEDEVKVTVIATGFNENEKKQLKPPAKPKTTIHEFPGKAARTTVSSAKEKSSYSNNVSSFTSRRPEQEIDKEDLDIPTFLRKRAD
ncbi:MAG: cell division protein FtsZ [bacterium]